MQPCQRPCHASFRSQCIPFSMRSELRWVRCGSSGVDANFKLQKTPEHGGTQEKRCCVSWFAARAKCNGDSPVCSFACRISTRMGQTLQNSVKQRPPKHTGEPMWTQQIQKNDVLHRRGAAQRICVPSTTPEFGDYERRVRCATCCPILCDK